MHRRAFLRFLGLAAPAAAVAPAVAATAARALPLSGTPATGFTPIGRYIPIHDPGHSHGLWEHVEMEKAAQQYRYLGLAPIKNEPWA